MILVDTSVWVDFFRPIGNPAGEALRRLIESSERLALTGVIVSEVLQGVRRDVDRVEAYLSIWDMLEPRGFSTYRQAASIFRTGRSRGISLMTVDCLIASIALDHGAVLFTRDRDFFHIAQVVPLELYASS